MTKETLLNKKIFTILFGLAVFFGTQSTTLAVSSTFSISPESAQIAAKSLTKVGNSTTITAGDGTKPTVTLTGFDQNGSKIIKISGLPESNYIQFRYDDTGNYMYDQTAYIPGSTTFSNVGDTRTFISEAGNGSEEITKLNTDGTKTVRRLYVGASKAYEYNINSSGVPVSSAQLSDLTLIERLTGGARNAAIIAGGVVGQKLQNAIKGMVGVGRYVPGTDARIDDLINNYVTGPTLSPLDETSLGTNFEVTTTNKAGIVNGSADQVDGGLCTLWDSDGVWSGIGGKLFSNKFSLFNCFEQLLYMGLVMVSWLVAMVGFVFNQIFTYTVTDMAVFVRSAGVIDGGWTAVRDMANILFIFILLYLAIATILQLDEHGVKHGLSRLIVAAMLVNFSLFFVKTVVDFSNRLAHSIYSQILDNGTSGTSTTITSGFPSIGAGFKSDSKLSWGLGDAVMGIFNFQNAFGMNQDKLNSTTSGAILGEQARSFASNSNSFTTFLMGIIMMLVIIFIFLAVIIIFVKRMVVLMFLMVFSPLGFAGMAIPNHGIEHSIQHKFWGTLFKEAFYAPLFFIIIYLGLSIANSPGFKQLVVVDNGSFFGIGVVISYLVVIYTFIAALVAAEEIGVQGASGALSIYSGLKEKVVGGSVNWATRNTVGRIADTMVNKHDGIIGFSDTLAKWATGVQKDGKTPLKGGVIGQWAQKNLARSVVKTATNLGHDFREKEVGEDVKAFQARIEEAHGDEGEIASILHEAGKKGISSSMLQAGDNIFHGFSTKTKAGVKLEMDRKIRDLHKNKYERKKDESDKDYINRMGLPMLPNEDMESYEKRVMEEKLDKEVADDKSMQRYFTGHGGGGRLEGPEISEVDRYVKGALPFWDKQLKEAVNTEILRDKFGKEASETDLDYDARIERERLKATDEIMSKFESPAQMLSALKSLKEDELKLFEGENQHAKDLRNKLSQITRDKFTTEAFYAEASKEPLFGKDMKEALAKPVWETAATFALYTKMNKDGIDDKTFEEFESSMRGIRSVREDIREYDAEIAHAAGNLNAKRAAKERLLKAYKEKRSGAETALANYSGQTNGTRTQIKSAEVIADLERISKILGKSINDVIKEGDKVDAPRPEAKSEAKSSTENFMDI